VKSPDKFLELTTECARSAQKTFVTEATKIGELYTAFAKEAFTPFTSNLAHKKLQATWLTGYQQPWTVSF
jgi:hypothetical protein